MVADNAIVAPPRPIPQDPSLTTTTEAPVTTVPQTATSPRTVTGRRTRVAMIGSGFIADVHLMVLRAAKDVEVIALVDPATARAERLAKKYGVPATYASVDDLLAAGNVDAVHVLVPPALHGPLALQCLQAGVHVLVEKPLVLRAEEVAELEAAAAATGAVLAVNHNQTCHPAVERVQRHLARGHLGKLEHVALQHNVPLRQLATGDVSHFMFQTEANIVWEQGVHLYSVVYALLGDCHEVHAAIGPRKALPNGVEFADEWSVTLQCERGTAHVRMAFGRALLETTVHCIGSDGAAVVDLTRNSCQWRNKTRWLEFFDHGINLARSGRHLLGRAFGAIAGYGLGLFGLAFPDDPFLRGMRGTLTAFHDAVRGRAPLPAPLTAAAARMVLTMCAKTAKAAGASLEAPPAPASLPEPGPVRDGEVVVLGGTGFLGRRSVAALRAQGRPVTMVVRKPHLLPAELRDGSVRVFQGDAADPELLARVFAGAETVLHLATVAGDSANEVERVMSTAVRQAGEAAIAAGVKRVVYASSTAALWLGDGTPVPGSVEPDPVPSARGAYARGKIASEKELFALRGKGTEFTIVRPAIVVGPDGIQEHSGVGLWVKDNHCVGWGRGHVPLPFVLADDCADGLVAALSAKNAGDRSYNLAGDVRLTAREYMRELQARTGRDYHFHPIFLRWMWLQEVGKYLVKVAARRPREWPAFRDFASRSFRAPLDCTDARRDLEFAPESDRGRFLDRMFGA
ncbi:MAG: Gfo/Idh/MocA family oxidoreductase [bacterium]|nr:Gfo/Idh/MocA family oxidoreductase [bacterium]